ncbi:hypothetical protein [Corallococcus exercitus]|uniref:ATP-binding protein n=1 Tax=Corallococcus exercitus TaxID=2316736 RepID=A0A7Y4KEN0_9BACT|nr:hypothetical protein [Corallococcus exercitus]NOK32443.1 hypothetical protein [Corallococcus exercitus]
MSKAIQLNRIETIQSVERHLLDLQESTGDAELRLPSDIPERIGVDASLLQLLMTWSQKQKVPKLRTLGLLNKDAETALDKMCENVVGLSAVTLSRAISSWDNVDIRSLGHAAAGRNVDAMVQESAKFQRGTSFAVLCFDGTSKAHPRNLYYANGDVLSARDFKALFTKRLELAEGNSARRVRIEDVATRLGTILFETFKNTHQWARTTIDGVPLRKSVRGLLIRRYRQHPAQANSSLEERHEKDAPLAGFLAKYLDPAGSGGVLEMSVFDGGPGLVRRFRGTSDLTSLSLEDERAACLECFDKHKTSSGMRHRGMGLCAAMRELHQLGGFLRLRTGRLSLFRNFYEEPFVEGAPASFTDWPGSENVANVAGTVLTFILPIPEVSQ